MPKLIAQGLSIEEFNRSKQLFEAKQASMSPFFFELDAPPNTSPTLKHMSSEPISQKQMQHDTIPLPPLPVRPAVLVRAASDTAVMKPTLLPPPAHPMIKRSKNPLLPQLPSVLPKLVRAISSRDIPKPHFYCQICLCNELEMNAFKVDICGHLFCKEVICKWAIFYLFDSPICAPTMIVPIAVRSGLIVKRCSLFL